MDLYLLLNHVKKFNHHSLSHLIRLLQHQKEQSIQNDNFGLPSSYYTSINSNSSFSPSSYPSNLSHLSKSHTFSSNTNTSMDEHSYEFYDSPIQSERIQYSLDMNEHFRHSKTSVYQQEGVYLRPVQKLMSQYFYSSLKLWYELQNGIIHTKNRINQNEFSSFNKNRVQINQYKNSELKNQKHLIQNEPKEFNEPNRMKNGSKSIIDSITTINSNTPNVLYQKLELNKSSMTFSKLLSLSGVDTLSSNTKYSPSKVIESSMAFMNEDSQNYNGIEIHSNQLDIINKNSLLLNDRESLKNIIDSLIKQIEDYLDQLSRVYIESMAQNSPDYSMVFFIALYRAQKGISCKYLTLIRDHEVQPFIDKLINFSHYRYGSIVNFEETFTTLLEEIAIKYSCFHMLEYDWENHCWNSSKYTNNLVNSENNNKNSQDNENEEWIIPEMVQSNNIKNDSQNISQINSIEEQNIIKDQSLDKDSKYNINNIKTQQNIDNNSHINNLINTNNIFDDLDSIFNKLPPTAKDLGKFFEDIVQDEDAETAISYYINRAQILGKHEETCLWYLSKAVFKSDSKAFLSLMNYIMQDRKELFATIRKRLFTSLYKFLSDLNDNQAKNFAKTVVEIRITDDITKKRLIHAIMSSSRKQVSTTLLDHLTKELFH